MSIRLDTDSSDDEEVPAFEPPESTGTADNALLIIATEVATTVPEEQLQALIESIQKTRQVPPELDRLLLGKSRTRLDAELDSRQKVQVRKAFLKVCETRLGRITKKT